MAKQGRAREAGSRLTPEQAFGRTMRRIRLERGLSQQVLADKSGYHRTYVGLLEGGGKSPSLRTIFNIATTLGVEPSEILRAVERLVHYSDARAPGAADR
jgi:transcriptional regulator with XRE-family HTH domain